MVLSTETGKGASFVALASTLLIAQKFREVVGDLQSAGS